MEPLTPQVHAGPTLHVQTTIVLRPSRAKWLAILAIGVAFSAIGVVMIRDGASAGWFVSGLFGLVALVAIVVLLPGSSFLKVRRDGFEFGTLFRRQHLPWTAVGPFSVAIVERQEMVVFDVLDPSCAPRLGRLARAYVGANAGLPDTYGLKAGELAAMLNAARERALARASMAG
jgi:hypothetical protein